MGETGLSIVVPAYNEAASIGPVLDGIRKALDPAELAYEILVVDDGSQDETAAVAKAGGVRLLVHPENRGYGAALKTGIRHAAHDLIAITDADGTYPNERLPELARLMLESGYDMVVGARTGEQVHIPLARRPAKWMLSRLANYLARTKIPDLNSGLRIFRKAVIHEFMRYLPSSFSFTTTLTLALLTNDYTVRHVPISYHKRVGRSKINPIRDTVNILGLIVRTVMYFAPLRVLLPISAALLLLAAAVLIVSLLFTPKVMDVTVVVITMTALQIAVVALVADLVQKRR
ncbi:MAG: glycosyltransferase family 2 protein [Anaerolineae bacterium]|jgi:glycosyltransferase involved in cell wall biosynthesis